MFAEDADQFGYNAIVQYFIPSDNDQGHFGIDPTSGRVFVQKPLSGIIEQILDKSASDHFDYGLHFVIL